MKRKILIFALCCTLLLGVFSVSAFAEEGEKEYYIKSFELKDSGHNFTGYVGSGESVKYAYTFDFTCGGQSFDGFTINFGQNSFSFQSGSSGKSLISGSSLYNKDLYNCSFNDYVLIDEPVYNWFVDNTNSLDAKVVEPHIHSYTSSIIAPTCTENGYTSYICECGDSYTDNEVAALGHSYSSMVVAPTCTEEGFTTHTCSNCGDSYTDSETAVIPHNYTTSSITPPTCTEKGGTSYVCSVCSHTYTEGNIDALGHNYSSSVIDPTCTEEGFTSHTCLTCGDVYTDNTVAPLGHSYSSIVTAPTCTKEGYTTHTCSVCNDKIIDTKVEALGHTFDEKMCTVCRAPNPDYYVRARDFASVISNLGDQLKVGPVVSVLVLVAGACVGLVFMWWAVRKLVHALMSAFKKGKISL